MPTFSNIDGEESSTVTFTVGAVSLTRNSSAELQEILCIGDPDVASSLGLARVTNTAPASSNAGLNVRILSGPSSVADFAVRAVLPSTYGDHGLRVLQSSAADLNVTVGNFSTTVNVSSLAGAVVVRSSAADHLASVYQSTFTDLNCRINAPSTCNSSNYLPVRLTNSTAFLEPASDYVHAVAMTVSTVAGPAVMLRASSTKPPAVSTSDMWVTQWGSLHGSAYVSMATDSGVSIMDSTASALKVNVVAGSAAGDTTVTVSTGSVRVHQSTAADLNVTVAGYSTTVNVS